MKTEANFEPSRVTVSHCPRVCACVRAYCVRASVCVSVCVVVGYRNTLITESLLHVDVPVHVKLFPRIGYLSGVFFWCFFFAVEYRNLSPLSLSTPPPPSPPTSNDRAVKTLNTLFCYLKQREDTDQTRRVFEPIHIATSKQASKQAPNHRIESLGIRALSGSAATPHPRQFSRELFKMDSLRGRGAY